MFSAVKTSMYVVNNFSALQMVQTCKYARREHMACPSYDPPTQLFRTYKASRLRFLHGRVGGREGVDFSLVLALALGDVTARLERTLSFTQPRFLRGRRNHPWVIRNGARAEMQDPLSRPLPAKTSARTHLNLTGTTIRQNRYGQRLNAVRNETIRQNIGKLANEWIRFIRSIKEKAVNELRKLGCHNVVLAYEAGPQAIYLVHIYTSQAAIISRDGGLSVYQGALDAW